MLSLLPIEYICPFWRHLGKVYLQTIATMRDRFPDLDNMEINSSLQSGLYYSISNFARMANIRNKRSSTDCGEVHENVIFCHVTLKDVLFQVFQQRSL